MFGKNEQFIVCILSKRPRISITSIMKLSYLIDLISVKERGSQISGFKYRRYTFGPFDEGVYEVTERLVLNNILLQSTEYTPMGDEYTIYSFNEDSKGFEFDALSKDEIKMIEDVVSELAGYGAKALTELTYSTAPMEEKGATIGGDEHLNEVLNLES